MAQLRYVVVGGFTGAQFRKQGFIIELIPICANIRRGLIKQPLSIKFR